MHSVKRISKNGLIRYFAGFRGNEQQWTSVRAKAKLFATEFLARSQKNMLRTQYIYLKVRES